MDEGTERGALRADGGLSRTEGEEFAAETAKYRQKEKVDVHLIDQGLPLIPPLFNDGIATVSEGDCRAHPKQREMANYVAVVVEGHIRCRQCMFKTWLMRLSLVANRAVAVQLAL